MQENEIREAAAKKAYEIAYAVSRVASSAGGEIGGILIKHGISLLDATLGHDIQGIMRAISGLGYLIKFGYGIDVISQRNTDLILAQMKLLGDMAAGLDTYGKPEMRKPSDIDLSGIFSDGFGNTFIENQMPSVEQSKEAAKDGSIVDVDRPDSTKIKLGDVRIEDAAMELLTEETREGDDAFAVSISAGIRQSTILKYIRQSGNCRMKELQDLFPRCSERTLRYDLESLIGRKLVERLGAGSATTYQALGDRS